MRNEKMNIDFFEEWINFYAELIGDKDSFIVRQARMGDDLMVGKISKMRFTFIKWQLRRDMTHQNSF